mmetsp:Transcript_86520/g.242277  ORF Transcript_86520/g.242277 Transcript_86520/m.242277 type:complete len:223 (+) Transcript_86520:78-746(+)
MLPSLPMLGVDGVMSAGSIVPVAFTSFFWGGKTSPSTWTQRFVSFKPFRNPFQYSWVRSSPWLNFASSSTVVWNWASKIFTLDSVLSSNELFSLKAADVLRISLECSSMVLWVCLCLATSDISFTSCRNFDCLRASALKSMLSTPTAFSSDTILSARRRESPSSSVARSASPLSSFVWPSVNSFKSLTCAMRLSQFLLSSRRSSTGFFTWLSCRMNCVSSAT